MKRYFFSLLFIFSGSTIVAQNVGLSVSCLIPRSGNFSTPISPLSIRGVGIGIYKFIRAETGVSLYRMAGLNVKGLPFQSDNALIGPNFTVYVPMLLAIRIKGKKYRVELKGGRFFFYGFDQSINEGNMDRAMRTYYGMEVLNSDLNFKNKPGWGYQAGVEYIYFVKKSFGLSLETTYLTGQSKFPMHGSYIGYDGANRVVQNVNYDKAKVDLTGLEISVGIVLKSDGKKGTK